MIAFQRKTLCVCNRESKRKRVTRIMGRTVTQEKAGVCVCWICFPVEKWYNIECYRYATIPSSKDTEVKTMLRMDNIDGLTYEHTKRVSRDVGIVSLFTRRY